MTVAIRIEWFNQDIVSTFVDAYLSMRIGQFEYVYLLLAFIWFHIVNEDNSSIFVCL